MTKKFILYLSIVIFITACVHQTKTTEVIQSQLKTPIASAMTQEPTKNLSIQEMKDQNLQQIAICVDKYSSLVEGEKQKKNYETIVLIDGQEGIKFAGTAGAKISDGFDDVQACIQQLNSEYFQLYKLDHELPTISPDAEIQHARLTELLESMNGWLEKERESGNVIEIYSPYEMKATPFVIGDAYSSGAIIEDEVKRLELALAGVSNNLIQFDIQAIQKINRKQVSLLGVSVFPYYRSDMKLTSYETEDYYYVVYSSSSAIIEIVPKDIPQSFDLTPVSPLTTGQLEENARQFIVAISPDVNLDALTIAHGSKIGSFFFRWEDRTKPLLDDGRSYPFIQVGLNLNGELLNYYNTLPLSR